MPAQSDEFVHALPVHAARVFETHRPTLACIEFQTPDGPKLFLATREGLLMIAGLLREFGEGMPTKRDLS